MQSFVCCLLAPAKGWVIDETLHMQCIIYILLISLFMTVGSWEWEICACV